MAADQGDENERAESQDDDRVRSAGREQLESDDRRPARADADAGLPSQPNSFGGPVEDRAITEPPLRLTGDAAGYEYTCDDEAYSGQPRLFWEKVLDDTGRANLVKTIVGSMTNR